MAEPGNTPANPQTTHLIQQLSQIKINLRDSTIGYDATIDGMQNVLDKLNAVSITLLAAALNETKEYRYTRLIETNATINKLSDVIVSDINNLTTKYDEIVEQIKKMSDQLNLLARSS